MISYKFAICRTNVQSRKVKNKNFITFMVIFIRLNRDWSMHSAHCTPIQPTQYIFHMIFRVSIDMCLSFTQMLQASFSFPYKHNFQFRWMLDIFATRQIELLYVVGNYYNETIKRSVKSLPFIHVFMRIIVKMIFHCAPCPMYNSSVCLEVIC